MDDRRQYWLENRSLILTACEWRAMHDDPELVADDAAARIEASRQPLGLKLLYRCVQDAVMASYQRQAARQSFIDSLRGNRPTLENKPVDDEDQKVLRGQVVNLSAKERDLLQLAWWDDLTLPELAEATGRRPEVVSAQLAQALDKYRSKVAKALRPYQADDLQRAFTALKPGRHRRHEL